MTEPAAEYRFYGNLASWWPLISPPAEYAEEAGEVAKLLASASGTVREVLELGSGGGHNAVHLKAGFDMTLVDLSEDMLRVSQQLNPDCEHQQGDMRTVRLGRTFDAVFVHDAVDYMTSEDDLRRAIETTYAHCRPGGVAGFVPDATAEAFTASSDCGGSDGTDGRAARYLDWTWDPDPAGNNVLTEYVFVLREADGSVDVVHETHCTGLFPRDVWLRLLTVVGFAAKMVIEETTEDRTPRDMFVARRLTPSTRRRAQIGGPGIWCGQAQTFSLSDPHMARPPVVPLARRPADRRGRIEAIARRMVAESAHA